MKFTMPRNAAHAEDLPDGRVVGPGDELELSEEEADDPRVKQLIEDGLLVQEQESEPEPEPLAHEQESEPKSKSRAKSTEKKGDS